MTQRVTNQPTSPAPPTPLSESQIAALAARFPKDGWPHAENQVAFWRALPELLAEGEEGRWALVADGRVRSIWDTNPDANQAGYELFGLDHPFMIARIARRDLERLAALAARWTPPGGESCPT